MYSSLAFVGLAALFIAGTQGASVAVPPASLRLQQLVTKIDLFQSAVGAAIGSVTPRGVGGIIPCGAEGEIVDTSFTDCEQVPCQTQVGNHYEVTVDFKPSIDHEALRLEIILIHDGANHPVVDVEVPNSQVEAGKQYRLGYTLRITDQILGASTLAFRLFGGSTPEICFIVGMNTTRP